MDLHQTSSVVCCTTVAGKYDFQFLTIRLKDYFLFHYLLFFIAVGTAAISIVFSYFLIIYIITFIYYLCYILYEYI